MWGKCSVDLMTWFSFPKYQRNKKKTVRGETKFWQRREDLKRREGERNWILVRDCSPLHLLVCLCPIIKTVLIIHTVVINIFRSLHPHTLCRAYSCERDVRE